MFAIGYTSGIFALTGFIGYTAEIAKTPNLMSEREVAAAYTCLALSLPAHIENVVLGILQVKNL